MSENGVQFSLAATKAGLQFSAGFRWKGQVNAQNAYFEGIRFLRLNRNLTLFGVKACAVGKAQSPADSQNG